MSSETLSSGLQRALGCHFHSDTDQLFFVESDRGTISRLDLFLKWYVKSSGTGTLEGTCHFDFDAGTGSGPRQDYDVWWQQETKVVRRLVPDPGARIVRLGPMSFGSVTPAYLLSLDYGSDPIAGNDDASNQLTSGTVFAVRTNIGQYAKVLVQSYGYNLEIQWITYRINTTRYRVQGRGYSSPRDIVVTGDGQTALVTDADELLRVPLTVQSDRSAATVIGSNLGKPQQIVLDQDRDLAYVVDYDRPGRLLRVDLASGQTTVLVTGLATATGLLLSEDRQLAYVSLGGAGGQDVVKVDLASGTVTDVASGLGRPTFMIWADPAESGILIGEGQRVLLIDLASGIPAGVRELATGLSSQVWGLALARPGQLLVSSLTHVHEVSLSPYAATGPLLLGVGHVPRDRIAQSGTLKGYADTSADAGYFFQVKDAPFGGTVSVMFNHTRAYLDEARYYRMSIGGEVVKQSFADYLWHNGPKRFEAQTISPDANGLFPVRLPSQLWYNPWLGCRLNTHVVSGGVHELEVKTYKTKTDPSPVASSILLRIDNQWPQASIDQILHNHSTLGTVVVPTCAIVTQDHDQFKFEITARDPEGHLLSWNLGTAWGDNKSKGVDSASYPPAGATAPTWHGLAGQSVPASWWHAAVAGDPTSTRCAHTFNLVVWDRVINGYNHIHRSTYHKSVTIYLP